MSGTRDRRTDPIRIFTWGMDTVHSVRFNPVVVMSDKAVSHGEG